VIGGLLNVAQSGLLFIDPERAHELTLRALERGVHERAPADDTRSTSTPDTAPSLSASATALA